ncbi:MAG: 3(2),5-bisphosphate nucleotidase [Bacteroidota bacterium]|jgi:3'(2'), 5'-bisphosphate nucleotidase|nr:3(2),5-bisphosphate nucleotidase [Bacteroidota bacterium]
MYHDLLHRSIYAALVAGKEILKIYDTDFSVEYKNDKSPVTLADKVASNVISDYLNSFNIPVLSEEGFHPDYNTRKKWNKLWIVDPLDGTKEFVKKNGEFTVNIAFVEDQSPKVGVIFSPVFNVLYFAASGLGAFKLEKEDVKNLQVSIKTSTIEDVISKAKKLPISRENKNYVVVASRSHMSKETYQHIEKIKTIHSQVDIVSIGSSIKMCWVAEGFANEYPRFGSTMEWDTAAGQAILQEAGCELIDGETSQPMKYNRENLLNNWFIARRK